MHKKFDSSEIEKKWQQVWEESGIYEAGERDVSKEKEYVLVELPYPSGNLHIGHWYAFAVPDIYVRFRRMNGVQAIYPMGFDAFGLPAENAAIKRDVDPREWTEKNIEYMRTQLKSMGNAFSWDKTASTIDPDYYRWTQWMFTQFFENDIAYRGTGKVNWCPGCNTVIANEQVLPDGTCERSGDEIEKKEMPQWMLRITDFADALIDDLESLDWPEHIKDAQRNWIGRSQGAEIDFPLNFTLKTSDVLSGDDGSSVTVFTTRPDTLYGATYLVLAPEHPLLKASQVRDQVSNLVEVDAYVAASSKKAEQDRLDNTKEKTGVKLEGITATNPANGEEIPVFIADYVLGGYGTGAIMAVPAHDERDNEFAKKFDLPITQVVRKVFGEPLPNPVPRIAAGAFIYDPKTDKYLVINSHEFKKHTLTFGGLDDGEDYAQAAIREALEETGYKTKFVRYVGDEVESHFYHPGKKLNRSLISRVALLEITDDTPKVIDAAELEKQEPVWLTASEMIKKLTDERDAFDCKMLFNETVFIDQGNLCNSGEFNGLKSSQAKEAIVAKVGGRMANTYRLRDWSVGRQRYWGVPIPIVYDPQGKAHPVPKEYLPWTLPDDVDFRPTGEAPLAKSEELRRRTVEIFGEGWTPEVETMDTFVDSSWYFLRYIDNQCDELPASLAAQKDWLPIDLYFGGAEHTTMHLLYSRFWQKALKKLGFAVHDEPYTRRINRGMILGPDGLKMSKSKGNVIDPDEQVARVGADTVKMYLAFMGPYGEVVNYPWDMGGIAGIRRFLERVYGLQEHIVEKEELSITQLLHRTIDKVSRDIVLLKFNTAISAMMEFVNGAEKNGLSTGSYNDFLRLLAPFAPHLCQELWQDAGNSTSIHLEAYPSADNTLLTQAAVTIGVQINGKRRGDITLAPDAAEIEAVAAAQAHPTIARWLAGEVDKVIYIPGKILNFIIKN